MSTTFQSTSTTEFVVPFQEVGEFRGDPAIVKLVLTIIVLLGLPFVVWRRNYRPLDRRPLLIRCLASLVMVWQSFNRIVTVIEYFFKLLLLFLMILLFVVRFFSKNNFLFCLLIIWKTHTSMLASSTVSMLLYTCCHVVCGNINGDIVCSTRVASLHGTTKSANQHKIISFGADWRATCRSVEVALVLSALGFETLHSIGSGVYCGGDVGNWSRRRACDKTETQFAVSESFPLHGGVLEQCTLSTSQVCFIRFHIMLMILFRFSFVFKISIVVKKLY